MSASSAYALFRLLVCVLYITCVVRVPLCGATEPSQGSDDKLAQVRKKYGREDIIRDVEHLQEDLKTITDLQLEGKLSEDETIFYFFRMHDFDNNNKLDGLELLAAMRHTENHEHNAGAPSANTDAEQFIPAVDSLLNLDKNNDGFLDYAELQSSSKDS